MTFETGAKTAQANDLVLTVMNDSASYSDRKHVIFSAMQSASHRGMTMRDIVSAEAHKQRKRFGSHFSAAHISEAAGIVWAQTLAHCLECIVGEWTGENIHARGHLWFDRINGNTYHSVRMVIPSNSDGGRIVDIPEQYGYGEQWKYSTVETLRRMGFTLPNDVPVWQQVPITWGDAVHVKRAAMFKGIRF